MSMILIITPLLHMGPCSMLALLSPDLRDYDLFFEVENFYIGMGQRILCQ